MLEKYKGGSPAKYFLGPIFALLLFHLPGWHSLRLGISWPRNDGVYLRSCLRGGNDMVEADVEFANLERPRNLPKNVPSDLDGYRSNDCWSWLKRVFLLCLQASSMLYFSKRHRSCSTPLRQQKKIYYGIWTPRFDTPSVPLDGSASYALAPPQWHGGFADAPGRAAAESPSL